MKNKYIDEYLALQDIRSEAFGEEYNNIAQKAKILSEYRPNETEQIFKYFKEAADKGGKQLDAQYCPLYVEATVKHLAAIKASSEQMDVLFEAYDFAAETLEEIIKVAKTEVEQATIAGNAKAIKKAETKLKNAQSYLALTEQIIEPFASCDKIIPIYEPKFAANPNDVELLKKITTNLDRKKCTKSELFFQATENLHKLEPNAKSAFMMGQMLIEKDRSEEAVPYLEEAVKNFEDNDSKAKASFLLATALMNAGQYGAARTAAYKVAEYDKSLEGKAVLIFSEKAEEIGKAITTSISRGATFLKGQGVYTGADKNVICCAVPKNEYVKLKRIVKEYDAKAFIITATADEVLGEGFIDIDR